MADSVRYGEIVADYYHWRRHFRCEMCGDESYITGRDVFDITVRRTLCRLHSDALAEANAAADPWSDLAVL